MAGRSGWQHREAMTTRTGLLAMLSTSVLGEEVDRVAAAVGARVIRLDPTDAVTPRIWMAADAVLLDQHAAGTVAAAGLPRRSNVFVLVSGGVGEQVGGDVLAAALAVGAQAALTLPGQDAELVGALARRGESTASGGGRGTVLAVVGGRGGAGASVFAAATALGAPGSLLIDLDSRGGGIDLLIGAESAAGLRWPDIAVPDGRLDWPAVRTALPTHRGISVLSARRDGQPISAVATGAVIEAGRSGGTVVVCDLPRGLDDPARLALDNADLVVAVASGDVRCCAATTALVPLLTELNPNVGLVVRGPSPGGLRPGEIADIAGLPLLAAMRPEPMLAEQLERGGLRLRARSPLAGAAGQVLGILRDGAA